MSSQELHDLLGQLKQERESGDLVDSEHRSRIDEIIESLEQQRIEPEAFDHFSILDDQINSVLAEIETRHPAIRGLLDGVQQVLRNFKP